MTSSSVPNPHVRFAKEAGIVMAIVGVIYFMSVSRQPLFGDGLEFLSAAAVGGIPHPTGYPLFMLLLGPFSGSYFSGSLLCAAFGVLASGCASIMIGRYLAPSLESLKENFQSVIRIALGVAVGFSYSLWTASTLIEVYALNTAIMGAALLILYSTKPESVLCWRQLTVVAFLLSLGLANHLMCISVLPIFGMRLIESIKAKHTSLKTFPLIVVAGIVPVVFLYATLMMRAAASPPINWGNPVGLDGILWHLGGGDYGATQFLKPQPGMDVSFTAASYAQFFFSRVVQLLLSLGGQLLGGPASFSTAKMILEGIIGFVFLCLIILGFKKLFTANRLLFIGQAVGVLFLLFVIFTYNIADIADYFLALFTLLFPIILIGLSSALNGLIAKMNYQSADRQIRVVVFAFALAVLALMSNSLDAMRGNDLSSRPITRKMTEVLPSNAIFMTHGDYDSYGFWYERYVEGRSQGVYHVPVNFMIYDWFDAMQPEEGIDSLGRHVNAMPGRFDQRTVIDQYNMIVDQIIEPHIDSVPIYTTNTDPMLMQLLGQNYMIEESAQLITDQQTFDAYIRQYSALPPVSVLQIKRKNQTEVAPSP